MRRGNYWIGRNEVLSLHEQKWREKYDVRHKSNKNGQTKEIKKMIVTMKRNTIAGRGHTQRII